MNKPAAQQNKKRPLIIQEPLEILKTASEQVGLAPAPKEENESNAPTEKEQVMKAKDTAVGQRHIEALNQEIKDIQVNKQTEQKQKLQEELASKQVVPEKPIQMSLAKRGRKLIGGMMNKLKRGKQNPEDNQKFVETRKPPST